MSGIFCFIETRHCEPAFRQTGVAWQSHDWN